ncbi:hypothetical protein ACFLYA_01670 [Candidatus Dependentiae bacterium]
MKKFLIALCVFLFLFQTKNFSNDCGVKQVLEQVLSKQDNMADVLSISEALQEESLEFLNSALDAQAIAQDNVLEATEVLLEYFSFIVELNETLSIIDAETKSQLLFDVDLLDVGLDDANLNVFKVSNPQDSIDRLRVTESNQFSTIDTVDNSHVITDAIFTLLDTTTQLAADLGLSLDECQAELDDLFSCIDLWNSVLDITCPPYQIICT